MVLDGMQDAIDLELDVHRREKFKSYKNPNKIHLVRYADDFIVCCANKDMLVHKIKPAITDFLQQRGLVLSAEKTTLTTIEKGFDFLGQNVRKYNNKLLIKPSKENVEVLLSKVLQQMPVLWPSFLIRKKINF